MLVDEIGVGCGEGMDEYGIMVVMVIAIVQSGRNLM